MKFLKVNIIIIFISLILASLLSINIIGAWGDSVAMGSENVSFIDYVSNWWNKTNGRISQILIFAILFQPIRQYIDTPLLYPWWLISAICFYCIITAPFLILRSLKKCNEINYDKFSIFYFIFLFITWIFNNRTIESFLWFNTSILCGYALSILFYSFLVYKLFISNQELLISRKTILYLSIVSIFFSLLLEPYILVIPLSIFLILISKRTEIISLRKIFQITLISMMSSIAGLIILLSSPGQIHRNKSLSLGINKITESLSFSITSGYRYLLDLEVGANIISRYFIFSIHFILFIYIFKNAYVFIASRQNYKLTNDNKINIYIFLSILFIIYHAFYITLFISDYFPTYLAMLPAFFLAIIYSIIIYTVFVSKNSFLFRKYPKIRSYSLFLFFSFLIVLLFHHTNENFKTFKSISINDNRRLVIYNIIEEDFRIHGITSFAIINCPVASTKHNYSMDPPWGFTAWFEWLDIKGLKIFLQQNYDFPSNWNDGSYKIIDCTKLNFQAPLTKLHQNNIVWPPTKL